MGVLGCGDQRLRPAYNGEGGWMRGNWNVTWVAGRGQMPFGESPGE